MQNAYLVFDIGTGNTRVALVGEDGAILDIAKENTRMYTDPIVSRAQYFKPQEWQDAVFSLIRGLLAAHPDVTVRAVTGSTLRQGIVLVGHDGESIVGYTNADRRGEGFMQELDWKRIWELTDLSPVSHFLRHQDSRHLEASAAGARTDEVLYLHQRLDGLRVYRSRRLGARAGDAERSV